MKITFLLLAVLFVFQCSAQQVTVDKSFNPTDKGFGKFNSGKSYHDDVEQSIIQPDGKLLVSGYFSFINDSVHNCIARLNPDGTLDKSFKVYGFESNFGNGVSMMKLQPDGKIIICTTYPEFNYKENIHIIRLNTDGTKDKTFTQAPLQYMPYYVNDVAIQTDGKLIVAGDGNQYGYGKSIVRLNKNGSYDKTFLPDSVHLYTILSLTITNKGKILAGGFFNLSDIAPAYKSIALINSDGSFDNSFSADIPYGYYVTKIALQPDSKILYTTNYIEAPIPSLFGRLNMDGSKDISFKVGSGTDRTVKAITPLANGQILIGGDFSTYRNVYAKGIARLNANGTLDRSFNSGTGISINSNIGYPDIKTINIDKAGNYFISGHFNVYNHIGAGCMLLLNTNGTIKHSFNPSNTTGADDAVFALAIQQDKKVIIAGDFIQYNGVVRNKIARLNADGTLDNSFTTGKGVQGDAADSNAFIHKLLIQPNGKILIGGNFSYINGQSQTLLARLNTNGSIDKTFKAKISKLYDYNYSQISAIALQQDGKILVGVSRNYLTENRESEPILYRLNNDGTIDSSFIVYDAFMGYDDNGNNEITSLAVQADGKILVGGYLRISSGSVTYNNIVRLNKNGTIDNTFSKNGLSLPGTDDGITDIHLMQDGKIMIAGYFGTYNGVAVAPVIRLNTNGLLDKTFKAPASLFKSLNFELAPISSDSSNIYIGFCSFTGSTLKTLHTNIYRLKSNGALDSTYNTGEGASSIVYTTALDANGKLLIGGSFTSFNKVGKNHIARLTIISSNKQTIASSVQATLRLQTAASIMVTPNPTASDVWLQTNNATAEKTTIKIMDAQGKQLSAISTVLPAGSSKQLLNMNQFVRVFIL